MKMFIKILLLEILYVYVLLDCYIGIKNFGKIRKFDIV